MPHQEKALKQGVPGLRAGYPFCLKRPKMAGHYTRSPVLHPGCDTVDSRALNPVPYGLWGSVRDGVKGLWVAFGGVEITGGR